MKKRYVSKFTNPYGLTDRQAEMMDSYVEHGSPKLVARELMVEITTVKSSLMVAMKKIGAKNRIQAAVRWDRSARAGTKSYLDQKPANSVFALSA